MIDNGLTDTPLASFDLLLGLLYEAVLAPEGFQAFIETWCDAFDLKAAQLIIRNESSQEAKVLWTHGFDLRWLESYALVYAPEDLLAMQMREAPIASFYASNLDIPHPERFPQTRFYKEWIVPQGVAYAAGGTILREGPWLTQVFLQRSPSQPPFSRGEIDVFNRLVPHMQRAFQMRQRFTDMQLGQNLLASSLDVLAMPTLLFDEFGRLAHSNRSADTLLASRQALWVEHGHLVTRDAEATRSLNLELTKVLRASQGQGSVLNGVVSLPRRGRTPLVLMLAPLRLKDEARMQGAALLFVFDPEATPSITADTVRQLFGLSKREAELAAALCSGLTLDDLAAERGTSINTVRSQLKSVFNKTGTSRQADLVSLLLASPAYFLAQE
ncbi:helix-turn-helix transcriptional regulator [Roseateles sp. NT4]|uniref:helix-turn-helix transcriptional regulator n=1 Tax=Roseateles sp. NT4 TaxID=3453715 RepID=UPI003EEFD3EC